MIFQAKNHLLNDAHQCVHSHQVEHWHVGCGTVIFVHLPKEISVKQDQFMKNIMEKNYSFKLIPCCESSCNHREQMEGRCELQRHPSPNRHSTYIEQHQGAQPRRSACATASSHLNNIKKIDLAMTRPTVCWIIDREKIFWFKIK